MLNRREETALLLLIVSLLAGSTVALVDYFSPGAVEDLHVIPGAVPYPQPQAVQGAATVRSDDPGVPAPVAAARDAGPGGLTPSPGLVPLNTASAEELQQLPGIGPRLAARILAFRDEHGSFTSIDALQQVRGVGRLTLARLVPLVALGPVVSKVDSGQTDTGQPRPMP